MQDVLAPKLSNKIDSFMRRKNQEFPELHLTNSAPYSQHRIENKNWKYDDVILPHGVFIVKSF